MDELIFDLFRSLFRCVREIAMKVSIDADLVLRCVRLDLFFKVYSVCLNSLVLFKLCAEDSPSQSLSLQESNLLRMCSTRSSSPLCEHLCRH